MLFAQYEAASQSVFSNPFLPQWMYQHTFQLCLPKQIFSSLVLMFQVVLIAETKTKNQAAFFVTKRTTNSQAMCHALQVKHSLYFDLGLIHLKHHLFEYVDSGVDRGKTLIFNELFP